MSRVVAALGGNALIRRGQLGSTEVQRLNLLSAARALVELVQAGHELVLTHGNGPQVGYLAIEAEAARDVVPAPPLDVLVAESEGQIGYLLAQALRAQLVLAGSSLDVVVLLTQTVVNRNDPAFAHPTKPVGPLYPRETAERLAAEMGWAVAQDGDGWRRVVPSPVPAAIVEAAAIRRLVDEGFIVVASGGGGVPVCRTLDGAYTGVEAVIDKDLAAVVLAEAVGADHLLLLTDVPAVHLRWGASDREPLGRLTLTEAAAGLDDGSFPPGSMGPKVRAAAAFVRHGGRAAIGALDQALPILDGLAGTQVIPDAPVAVHSGPRR